MNQEEFEREIKSMFDGLNKKLDKLIKHLDKQLGVEEESPLNKWLRLVTSKDTTDKDYCQALVELNKLPFALSAKQIAWCLVYTPRHANCGESIQIFIKKQFEKHQNKNEYINGIAEVLRMKYKNEGNDQYIEKLIQRIQEI